MARVSWRGDIRKMAMRIENLPDEMMDMAEEVMEDTVEDGADLMRHYIKTRATDKVRNGIPPRDGRTKSWDMHDAVETNVKRNRRSIVGKFGWGVAGGPDEDYFSYQENGFRHWRSGKDVVPMHALLDAFIQNREQFFARMRSEMRSRR